MAGVQNIVELLFRVSDQATGPTKTMSSNFEGLKSSAMAAAAAAAAIGAGALAAAKKVVDLGSKFEDTSINIAGNIRAFNLAPTFDEATKSAANALGTIEAMAAKLPGETDQYVEVFKTALPKAIESGMTDIKAITDLTSRFTAVAVSSGVDEMQAGANLFRMLAGQADVENRMFTTLAPHLKMTAAEFNKLTMEARRLAIDKSLGNFTEMMEAAGGTFSSKMGEAQSHLKTLVRLGGEPIFQAAVEGLTQMNEYLTSHKITLVEMVKLMSKDLVEGATALFQKFEKIWNIGKEIVKVFIAFKVGVVSAELVNGLMILVKLFKQIRAAAVSAAAAEAFATGGTSAIVGAVAAASVYTAFGLADDETIETFDRKQLAAEKAAKAVEIAEMNKGVAELSAVLSDITQGRYTKIQNIMGAEGKDAARMALEAVGKAGYDRLTEKGQAAFASMAKDLGVSVEKYSKGPKYAPASKLGLPGGPKKADVVIENARFDIKQSFAEGYDPDRIAAAFVDQIGSTALYPGQSGFAAAGTSGA